MDGGAHRDMGSIAFVFPAKQHSFSTFKTAIKLEAVATYLSGIAEKASRIKFLKFGAPGLSQFLRLPSSVVISHSPPWSEVKRKCLAKKDGGNNKPKREKVIYFDDLYSLFFSNVVITQS